ncbi:MAG: amino acid permease [Candidatus Peribacteria bacterium]|nr:amino acid permease [Candidatus Peribacteria bacterium]
MEQAHTASAHHPHAHTKLGQLYATAISGNDIMSSCLYVSGIAILFAGIYAPLILLSIGAVLFLYKMVYIEVVEALPVNGGAYNCLLNATSKTVAAVAGVMTFLSYVATAVISAKVGVVFLHSILPASVDAFFAPFSFIGGDAANTAIIVITVLVLLAFAILVIGGVKDSAKVAFGIFAFHLLILTSVVLYGAYYAFILHGASHFADNYAQTAGVIREHGGIAKTLFFAFSACLLGVSGFESSANFVEEQQRGVFRKTLRNMLLGVVIFNPLIALVILNTIPIESVTEATTDYVLINTSKDLGGMIFQYFVVIDAFLVLCGAVLTSYVGVSGLLNRMSSDGCLPSFFNKENKKGSFPRIIITFFLLCTSILVATKGNTLSLAGVYTIAFLGVMTLFAFGNLVLKEARKDLKRTYHAPRIVALVALISTAAGMIGNILINHQNIVFFATYFVPVMLIVLVIIYADFVLRGLMRMFGNMSGISKAIQRYFSDITGGKYVVFIHHANRLYSALDYLNRNETGRNVTLVYCNNGAMDTEDDDKNFKEIQETLPYLVKAGFMPHMTVDLKYVDKPFGPETIDSVSREMGIRKNRIMIGSIHDFHEFEYDELGGVRIIFG